jgi:hypothetical protein
VHDAFCIAMRILRPSVVLVVPLCFVACGSSDDATKSPSGAKCSGDSTAGPCVTNVVGALSDELGAPVPNAPVSVCGDICYYGQSDDAGAFDVTVGAFIDASKYHLLVHARPLRAGYYYSLPASAVNGTVEAGTSMVLTLPADGPTLALSGSGAPAQTLTSGDVTLEVPDGVDVKLDVEDVTLGADGAKLRAVTVPASARDAFIEPSLGALALYAIAPFEATFREKGTKNAAKSGVSFANTTGLAADTPVEILAMGSYYVDQAIAPGEFGPVAIGHVSSDGGSIALDAGEGIEYLTWLAVRAKK